MLEDKAAGDGGFGPGHCEQRSEAAEVKGGLDFQGVVKND
jgi:hypothetical protein